MSLRSEPLLIFKGLEKEPLHGRYAEGSPGQSGMASIHDALQRPIVVTFEDATRHIITLGSTGSRKTSTVQAPAIVRLIETGCAGLIIDVKGEYRHLAEQYPERVMVVGADDHARPFNLIAGMSDGQFEAFLNDICPSHSDRYWGSMGLQDAFFVRRTYQLMNIEPTLAQIRDALASPNIFVRTFDRFARWMKTLPSEYHELLRSVLSNQFSVLAMGGSALLNGKAVPEDDIRKQYTWQTSGIIKALAPFSTDNLLRRKFSPDISDGNASESCISLEKLLYQDRKVLLLDIPVSRFGNTANIIGKLLRIRLISAITGFRRHSELGCGESFYTFLAADEYQDMINIDQKSASGGLYDDTTFFDRCRGFGHINIVATQSVSALRAKVPYGERSEALDCLLQNIGTVIVFSSSDPSTDDLLRGRVATVDAMQISSVVRSDLQAGEAFILGRGLIRHQSCNFVAKFRATAVSGAPYMSRYFAGLPDPRFYVSYTEDNRSTANPFALRGAPSPYSEEPALKESFEQNKAQLISKIFEHAGSVKIGPMTLMNDRDFCLSVSGFIGKLKTPLSSQVLELKIRSTSVMGWEVALPICRAIAIAEETIAKETALRKKEDPSEWVLSGNMTMEAEIVLDERFRLSTMRYVDGDISETVACLGGRSGASFMPLKSWILICRCLLALEKQYNQEVVRIPLLRPESEEKF
ncbi:helicase HerA domain-containing protein [Allohahella marinimesophila]|uniref:Helicase HerA central domain-containing protein n=1 Tax=Allohahella marinimesophila TaxID=1054972 RepID=A0ABP7Q7M5_9GAMM